jgi:hypothetical protein
LSRYRQPSSSSQYAPVPTHDTVGYSSDRVVSRYRRVLRRRRRLSIPRQRRCSSSSSIRAEVTSRSATRSAGWASAFPQRPVLSLLRRRRLRRRATTTVVDTSTTTMLLLLLHKSRNRPLHPLRADRPWDLVVGHGLATAVVVAPAQPAERFDRIAHCRRRVVECRERTLPPPPPQDRSPTSKSRPASSIESADEAATWSCHCRRRCTRAACRTVRPDRPLPPPRRRILRNEGGRERTLPPPPPQDRSPTSKSRPASSIESADEAASEYLRRRLVRRLD